MMEFVSWDDGISNMMGKSFKIPWFQSPPTKKEISGGTPMGLPGLPSSWEWEMRQNYDARMVKILRSVSEAYSDAGWCF